MEQAISFDNLGVLSAKINFMFSLFDTLYNLKEDGNIDSVYVYQGSDKIEIYIFDKKESFDTEDFVTKTLSKWEVQQGYFPEVFINQSDNEMQILPRKAYKIC